MFTEVVNQKTKKAQSILSVVLICAQEDEKYAESIGKQISASGNRVDYFSNRMLKGGSNEKLEVISRINSADLIFILLSPDFACQLADDESKESEYLSEAKTRHESQNGSIIPIRVRACEWEHLH